MSAVFVCDHAKAGAFVSKDACERTCLAGACVYTREVLMLML